MPVKDRLRIQWLWLPWVPPLGQACWLRESARRISATSWSSGVEPITACRPWLMLDVWHAGHAVLVRQLAELER